ncbi:MAG TPA: hypothetical protein VER36_08835 [Flavisolibacter sp.]|nr:hypothetical protein [Flavisolibacter sp.]
MMIKQILSPFVFTAIVVLAHAQDRVYSQATAAVPDSVVTFASSLYKPNSFLRTLFMGKNYRSEWEQKVTLPVFYFSGSGFRIKELGGGMQTKSLHMIDSLGKEWSLRTVDKDVSAAPVAFLQSSLGQKVAQDMISSAFPYGAVLAGELSHAAGLRTARPRVYFIADDSGLGPYRSLFANTLCTLEERDPGFDNTDDSETVLDNLTKENRFKIQQLVLLRARILDMLMADWDRHADNWRWGRADSADFTFYYAVPRDRDWAFYKSKGWIPKVVQLTGAMRCFVPFGPELKNIKDLSWKAWTMDKTFLNEMTGADWEKTIQHLQAALTDDVLEAAVKKLPVSIFETDGQWFIQSLKRRRDVLKKEVMKYYRFLAEEPIVNGSNANERFVIASDDNGLTVTVYSLDAEQRKLYERRFLSAETYFITLNGLGGADVFEVKENCRSKIRLIINGGDGEDHYNLKGNIRTTVKDAASDKNVLLFKGTAKVHFK